MSSALTAAAAAAAAGAAGALAAAAGPVPTRAVRRRAELRSRHDPVAALGSAATRCLAPGAPPPSPAAARRTAVVLCAGAALVPVVPHALVLALAWCAAAPRVRASRAARRHAADIADALPDAVDLLRLATSAGLPAPLALPLVARRARGPIAAAFAAADCQAAAGAGRAQTLLAELGALGDAPRALGHVLADHLRHGAPLAPALDQLAFEARVDRRHRAEQAARRVPVRLLLPLVTCILPAFGLLTVVPLLAGSLQSLAG